MSVFVLKLIAVVSMFIDHLTYVLRLSGNLSNVDLYYLGRSIGRPAFVIYCFLLVNGFDKTRDRGKYLGRLILFALVSQLPYSLAFTAGNYWPDSSSLFRIDWLSLLPLLLPLAVYFLYGCSCRPTLSLFALAAAFVLTRTQLIVRGVCVFSDEMNVFYTLAVSMALMMFFDRLFADEKRDWVKLLLIAAALGSELYFVQQEADYGLIGVALVLGLYFCRGKKPVQLLVLAVWCVLEYHKSWFYLVGALAALLPVLLYNGRLGPKMRSFFYVFYPAHLALLGAVFIYLARIAKASFA